MKFQELAAIIGGFMKIVMFFGQNLSNFVNYSIRENDLYSEFFNYYKIDESKLVHNKNESFNVFKNESQFQELNLPNKQNINNYLN